MKKNLRIGIIGAPSVGKSTLSNVLSKFLGFELIGEYATEYFYKNGTFVDLSVQTHLFDAQFDRELSSLSIVSESPAFLTFIYLSLCDTDAVCIGNYLGRALTSLYSYDLVVYIPIEFEQVASDIRVFDEDGRMLIDSMIRLFLVAKAKEDQLIEVRGTVEERLDQVLKVLRERYHV